MRQCTHVNGEAARAHPESSTGTRCRMFVDSMIGPISDSTPLSDSSATILHSELQLPQQRSSSMSGIRTDHNVVTITLEDYSTHENAAVVVYWVIAGWNDSSCPNTCPNLSSEHPLGLPATELDPQSSYTRLLARKRTVYLSRGSGCSDKRTVWAWGIGVG